MEAASDDTIWKLAIAEQFVIVSKDSDLYQMSLVRGAPPKVIWLRTGNCATQAIVLLLQARRINVNAFCNDESSSFLVLS
jgi:predicted nuclease of predicted toxin-antitoxin system